MEDAKGRKDMREKRPPLLFSLLCTQVGGKKEVAMNKKSVRLSERAEGITKEATAPPTSGPTARSLFPTLERETE